MDNQSIYTTVQSTNKPVLQQADVAELKRKEGRFRTFGLGSFLYALFYTFCLYHNASGITYPFFAGGTLYFFMRFIKKSGSSSADGKNGHINEHINKKFLMISILIAGALNCATDSGVLIFFNKALLFLLLGVLLLQCWHDVTDWSITAYIQGLVYTLFGGVCSLFAPVTDWAAKCRLDSMDGRKREADPERRRIVKAVGLGLLITAPVAMFILILLGSADVIFGKMLFDILLFPFELDMDVLELAGNGIAVVFEIILVFAVCYGIFAYNTEQKNRKAIDDMTASGKTAWDPYIAVTVNAVMCLIYVVFSGIQIFGLFLGNVPEEYTYAAYARRGFFELLFVCLFNIVLVLFTLGYFGSSKVLKALLTVVCGCTYIMTVSSAYRMLLYIGSYQLTFLRLFVLWALLMIAVVMAGVLRYIYNLQFSLFRFMLMVLTVGWLSFSALHPDYWIALYNSNMGGDFDRQYLKTELSLDAVPALSEEICRDHGSCYYRSAGEYRESVQGFLGARKFNLSRAYAARCMDVDN